MDSQFWTRLELQLKMMQPQQLTQEVDELPDRSPIHTTVLGEVPIEYLLDPMRIYYLADRNLTRTQFEAFVEQSGDIYRLITSRGHLKVIRTWLWVRYLQAVTWDDLNKPSLGGPTAAKFAIISHVDRHKSDQVV